MQEKRICRGCETWSVTVGLFIFRLTQHRKWQYLFIRDIYYDVFRPVHCGGWAEGVREKCVEEDVWVLGRGGQ